MGRPAICRNRWLTERWGQEYNVLPWLCESFYAVLLIWWRAVEALLYKLSCAITHCVGVCRLTVDVNEFLFYYST